MSKAFREFGGRGKGRQGERKGRDGKGERPTGGSQTKQKKPRTRSLLLRHLPRFTEVRATAPILRNDPRHTARGPRPFLPSGDTGRSQGRLQWLEARGQRADQMGSLSGSLPLSGIRFLEVVFNTRQQPGRSENPISGLRRPGTGPTAGPGPPSSVAPSLPRPPRGPSPRPPFQLGRPPEGPLWPQGHAVSSFPHSPPSPRRLRQEGAQPRGRERREAAPA